MKTKLALAISAALALTACDDYELASEGGGFHSPSSIEIIGDAEDKETLTAVVTDYDNFNAETVTYTWTANDDIRPDITGSTYLLKTSDVGSVFTVKAEFVDNAGYNEVAISKATPVVEPESIPEQGSATLKGDAIVGSILEVIVDEPNGTSETDITYQWFAGTDSITEKLINSAGAKYRLTSDEVGQEITVQVSYTDDDGAKEDFRSEASDIVIEKTVETIDGNVATINDSFDDAKGSLGIKFSESATSIDPVLTGKVSLIFAKELAITAEGKARDAYISILGSEDKLENALIDFKIKNSGYAIRQYQKNSDGTPILDEDGDYISDDISLTTSYTPEEWVKIDIEWDATEATSDKAATIKVLLDGELAWEGDSTAFDTSQLSAGVQKILFVQGDTSSVADGSFRIDDLKIYSSDTTADEVVWEDDFDDYDAGISLAKGADEGAPYNTGATNAVTEYVERKDPDAEDPTDPTEPGDENNNALSIFDNSTSSDGHVFFSPETAIEKGRVTLSFQKPTNAEGSDGDQKDAYIGLYTASSNANALIDLRLHGVYPDDGGLPEDGKDVVDYGTLEQRSTSPKGETPQNGSGLWADPLVELTATDSSIVPQGGKYNQGMHYAVGEWQTVEMTWDATSDTEQATITVTLNGDVENKRTFLSVHTLESGSYVEPDLTTDMLKSLTLRFSDGTRTVNSGKTDFQVDDIKLYSIDDEGKETLVLDKDFESYDIGDEIKKPVDGGTDTDVTKVSQAVVAKRHL